MRVAVADGFGTAFQSGQVVLVDDDLAVLWEGLGYIEALPDEGEDTLDGDALAAVEPVEHITLPAVDVELGDGDTFPAVVLSVPLSSELLDQLADIATDEDEGRAVSLTVVVDADGNVVVDTAPVLADADQVGEDPVDLDKHDGTEPETAEPGEQGDAGQPAEPSTSGRPRGNASYPEWVAYARTLGATDPELEGLSRDAIRERWGK